MRLVAAIVSFSRAKWPEEPVGVALRGCTGKELGVAVVVVVQEPAIKGEVSRLLLR